MARNVRSYDHFCVVARALEQLGDRWSLLVVRDLLSGPKRFTDLMGRLGGITPKTLSQRLHDLDEAGIVEVDRVAGRREVWYRLSPAGEDAGPVVDALLVWGMRHAWRRPRDGERVHPEHLLRAVVAAIDTASDDRGPAHWRLDLAGETYHVTSEDGRWTYGTHAPPTPPTLTLTSGAQAFEHFLLDGRTEEVTLEGDPAEIARFARLVGTVATVVGG
jgi:DNA-binding HxlR family transcriptional regulator